MAIVAYVGKPRSGKSYGVVENVIIPALKNKRTVITNIPLKTGYLSDDFPTGNVIQFSPKDPLDNPQFFDPADYPGAIWVIDECWRYWPSGLKANQMTELTKQFFTEHGHFVGDDGRTTEIVLVTQSLDQICAFIRNLIEETFRAVKLSALGASKKYRVDVFSGAQKGLEGGKPNRQLMGTYKPDVYKYYVSHTHNKTDFAAGMEEKPDDRNNIFKSPFFRFVVPGAALLAVYSFFSAFSYFGDEEKEPPKMKQEIQQYQKPVFHTASVQAPQENTREERAAAAMLELDYSREYLPVSRTHRITGIFGDRYYISGPNGERFVPTYLCSRFSNTKEPYCVFNGELVTYYSGTKPKQEFVEVDYLNDFNLFGSTSDERGES